MLPGGSSDDQMSSFQSSTITQTLTLLSSVPTNTYIAAITGFLISSHTSQGNENYFLSLSKINELEDDGEYGRLCFKDKEWEVAH